MYSLLAGTFHGCIEACNNWNNYTHASDSKACQAVSFVTDWTDISFAKHVNASGNCWLKPGPQKVGDLREANGTHAAIVAS